MKFILIVILYVADYDSNVDPVFLTRAFPTAEACVEEKDRVLKVGTARPIRGAAMCVSENELLEYKIS